MSLFLLFHLLHDDHMVLYYNYFLIKKKQAVKDYKKHYKIIENRFFCKISLYLFSCKISKTNFYKIKYFSNCLDSTSFASLPLHVNTQIFKGFGNKLPNLTE